MSIDTARLLIRQYYMQLWYGIVCCTYISISSVVGRTVCSIHTIPYHNCIYSRLTEDEQCVRYTLYRTITVYTAVWLKMNSVFDTHYTITVYTAVWLKMNSVFDTHYTITVYTAVSLKMNSVFDTHYTITVYTAVWLKMNRRFRKMQRT